jgi:hypothetical protein
MRLKRAVLVTAVVFMAFTLFSGDYVGVVKATSTFGGEFVGEPYPSLYLSGLKEKIRVPFKNTGTQMADFAVLVDSQPSGWILDSGELLYPDYQDVVGDVEPGNISYAFFEVTPPAGGGSGTITFTLWVDTDGVYQDTISVQVSTADTYTPSTPGLKVMSFDDIRYDEGQQVLNKYQAMAEYVFQDFHPIKIGYWTDDAYNFRLTLEVDGQPHSYVPVLIGSGKDQMKGFIDITTITAVNDWETYYLLSFFHEYMKDIKSYWYTDDTGFQPNLTVDNPYDAENYKTHMGHLASEDIDVRDYAHDTVIAVGLAQIAWNIPAIIYSLRTATKNWDAVAELAGQSGSIAVAMWQDKGWNASDIDQAYDVVMSKNVTKQQIADWIDNVIILRDWAGIIEDWTTVIRNYKNTRAMITTSVTNIWKYYKASIIAQYGTEENYLTTKLDGVIKLVVKNLKTSYGVVTTFNEFKNELGNTAFGSHVTDAAKCLRAVYERASWIKTGLKQGVQRIKTQDIPGILNEIVQYLDAIVNDGPMTSPLTGTTIPKGYFLQALDDIDEVAKTIALAAGVTGYQYDLTQNNYYKDVKDQLTTYSKNAHRALEQAGALLTIADQYATYAADFQKPDGSIFIAANHFFGGYDIVKAAQRMEFIYNFLLQIDKEKIMLINYMERQYMRADLLERYASLDSLYWALKAHAWEIWNQAVQNNWWIDILNSLISWITGKDYLEDIQSTVTLYNNRADQQIAAYNNAKNNAKQNYEKYIVFSEEFVIPVVGESLIIDGTTVTLGGEHIYDLVWIKNGGILYVRPYNGTESTGKLSLKANEIIVEAGSAIIADYAGYRGYVMVRDDGSVIENFIGHAEPRDYDIAFGEGPITATGPSGGRAYGHSGGGGGYGGHGGKGGFKPGEGEGSEPYGTVDGEDIGMGAAGGAWVYYDSWGRGGSGGGAIRLEANFIFIAGTISANGENGFYGEHGSGGGAGGGILIKGHQITISGTLRANGGRGGNAPGCWDRVGGGGGSGGRIKIFYGSLNLTGTVSVAGGDRGYGYRNGAPGEAGTFYTAKTLSEKPPPEPLPRKTEVFLGCPANATITDSEGRVTGYVNGIFVNNIPYATVFSYGENEIYALPYNVTGKIDIIALAEGKYNFALKKRESLLVQYTYSVTNAFMSLGDVDTYGFFQNGTMFTASTTGSAKNVTLHVTRNEYLIITTTAINLTLDATPTTLQVQNETITVTHGNVSWTVPFAPPTMAPPPTVQYQLTVQTQPADVVTIPGEGVYDEGTNVTLEAPAIVNVTVGVRYRFSHWTVDGANVTGNPIGVVMDTDHTATAHYIKQYHLTIISPYDTPGGQGWYDEGETAYALLQVGLEYVDGTAYGFTGWTGDASGRDLISNPIIMDAPKTAIANWNASEIYGDVQTIGFWKHQINVWYFTELKNSGMKLRGIGKAQTTEEELLGYLIYVDDNSDYFRGRLVVYNADGTVNALETLRNAYNLMKTPNGPDAMKQRAEQQLLAVWLNLASQRYFWNTQLSQENIYIYYQYNYEAEQGLTTIGEAIKWAEAVMSDPNGNYEAVKSVCDSINNNQGIIWGT